MMKGKRIVLNVKKMNFDLNTHIPQVIIKTKNDSINFLGIYA